eukprot:CAMPEP_0119521724 /NCGR_PEP_ID=MMETSP1344-20130328/37334_1 /TAXON_ID=236787 /ORGANISM="Florenciella parvula, Strain CCMP2471" /LENGTH=175 /DNA_ID=CAMNT_0007559721 /DNA_START=343 /DNA_END=867 /DNA_ORIENTATION=-
MPPKPFRVVAGARRPASTPSGGQQTRCSLQHEQLPATAGLVNDVDSHGTVKLLLGMQVVDRAHATRNQHVAVFSKVIGRLLPFSHLLWELKYLQNFSSSSAAAACRMPCRNVCRGLVYGGIRFGDLGGELGLLLVVVITDVREHEYEDNDEADAGWDGVRQSLHARLSVLVPTAL